MIELTEDQRRELQGPTPVRVYDPNAKVTYVLVREDVYQRLASLVDDVDPEVFYPLLGRDRAG